MSCVGLLCSRHALVQQHSWAWLNILFSCCHKREGKEEEEAEAEEEAVEGEVGSYSVTTALLTPTPLIALSS